MGQRRPQPPLRRVLACAEVSAATKERLRAEKTGAQSVCPDAGSGAADESHRSQPAREWIKSSRPRNGNDGGRTATVPQLPSRPIFKGLGITPLLSQPEHFPASSWITPLLSYGGSGMRATLALVFVLVCGKNPKRERERSRKNIRRLLMRKERQAKEDFTFYDSDHGKKGEALRKIKEADGDASDYFYSQPGQVAGILRRKMSK